MLTEKDIENLRLYSEKFNDFCKNHECNDECRILALSRKLEKSCFQAYCDSQDIDIVNS